MGSPASGASGATNTTDRAQAIRGRWGVPNPEGHAVRSAQSGHARNAVQRPAGRLGFRPLARRRESEGIAVGYIGFGLTSIIVGVLLFHGTDSPATVERSEMFGLLLIATGVVAVLIGMVAHVVAVNRAERRP
jgi:hypothetical protein